ncbi:hypothetical protein Pmani_028767 [Petrolisthes manimaculis]|uniref:ZP domain-containing protein n=1 Tax=Petrolisthes manimaculis TaxID=1843537 RepID=A0AAE1NYW6_9EUCA|nr:hypothetical protein Pmani_028767 [Petrolisthes manimaculis]
MGHAELRYSVECSADTMTVRVPLQGVEQVALNKWGHLPWCGVRMDSTQYILSLPLDDDLACGTTRVRNKYTGDTMYYNKVEVTTISSTTHVLLVKCQVAADNSTVNNIVKRNVLPAEFVEPDFIEITSEVTGMAPIPILGVGVRQDGNLVGGELNVRPGTPLTMEVYLDDTSANIYGILMSYMEVTDTQDKRETIIFNGCSVDPLLFDNFVTTTGDYVSAKFRAFKFPETNYVLFRGTVDVCLDKCQGIACSNGQLGYGRRRRGVDASSIDRNKIFEVTMSTYLKVVKDENLNTTNNEEAKSLGDMEKMAGDLERAAGGLRKVAVDLVRQVEEDVERAMEETHHNPSFQTRQGDEPVFVYYNIGSSLSQSFVSIVAAVLCILLLH